MDTRKLKVILAVCLWLFAGMAINTKAQKAELVVQTGHSSGVNVVVFSPDGKTLAAGGLGNTLKLWEVESGRELRTLTGHSDEIRDLSYSADGLVLASKSLGGTIKIWNTASGQELRTFDEPGVWSIALSPDGKTLALGNSDGTIKLCDVEGGNVSRTLTGHPFTSYIQKDVTNTRSQRFFRAGMVWSLAFSPDGKTLASGSADMTIKIWNTDNGKELRTLKGHSETVKSVAFSSDGKILASGSYDQTIKIWDTENGEVLRTLTGHSAQIEPVAFTPDGKTLTSSDEKTIKIWNVNSGKATRTLTLHSDSVGSVAFSPDGKTLASISDETIKIWNTESEKELRTLKGRSVPVESVAFGANGRTLRSESKDQTLIWDLESGKGLRTLAGHPDSFWTNRLKALTGYPNIGEVALSPDQKTFAETAENEDSTIAIRSRTSGKTIRRFGGQNDHVGALAFSPDGKTLASGSDDQTVTIWNTASGKELWTLTGHSSTVTSVAFSSDGKTLASGSLDKTIKLWNTASGKELRTLTGHSAYVGSVAFSPDRKILASESADGKTKLWDVATGKEICTLVALDNQDWVVTTPQGRFDTNNLEESQGLHWVVSDDPFRAIGLEIFMRDYYEPQLLSRILKCSKEGNCDREFKPVRDISKLNRVQPPVRISNVSLPDAEGFVSVTVEVGNNQGENPDKSTRQTGVYDLRLFRDGQMVGGWPSDGAEKLLRRASINSRLNEELVGDGRQSRELRDWQQATEVKPDNGVKVDQKTGMLTLPAFRVKLPRGKDASAIDFSAYAFNDDRVKGQTAHWQWPDDLKAKLPKAQAVKGRAYVVTIGVNAYENPDWNLKYAANDARQIQRTLVESLSRGGEYQEVVRVSLISDYKVTNRQSVVTEKSATKQSIRTVLDLLAGKQVDAEVLKSIPNAGGLRKAEPEDLIILSFSSHGYADNQGNFYFVPYDVGPGSKREITAELLRHCISSEELSLWLRDVDAGEMVMVVDACHSAASVQGEGFKPGPMGSRGLGQLSYDKGIRILTSTQSDDVALETEFTQQGLLSYALTHDGIEAGRADFKPRDRVIMLAEWLEYATDRVPKLYGEIEVKYQSLALNELKSIGQGRGARTKLLIFSRDGSESSFKKGSNQQPSLFDFTRKKRPVVLTRTR